MLVLVLVTLILIVVIVHVFALIPMPIHMPMLTCVRSVGARFGTGAGYVRSGGAERGKSSEVALPFDELVEEGAVGRYGG